MNSVPAWAQQAEAPQPPKWAAPKWATSPAAAPVAPKAAPSVAPEVFGDLATGMSQLSRAPADTAKSYLGATEEAFNTARGVAQQGVADMKSGEGLRMLVGAMEAIRGTVGEIAAPATGAFLGPLQWADPGLLPEAARVPEAASAPKPRVEPPALSTAPKIARNSEGRPVVPRGGLQDDEMAKLTRAFKEAGIDTESPALKAAEKIDPRAALAGQAAVAKVADRVARAEPPKWAAPAPAAGGVDPRAALAGQAAVAKVADRTALKPEPPKWAAPKPAATSPVVHPQKGEHGEPVTIKTPHTPTPEADYFKDVTTFTPGSPAPKGFTPYTPPSDWSTLPKDAPKQKFFEMPKNGLPAGSGALIESMDGKGYWVVSPTNKFGGYENTLPKGKMDKGLSMQQNAMKEVFEETGLKVKIIDHIDDLMSPYSKTRYYIAKHEAGVPGGMGWESQAVHWVPKDKIVSFLKNPDESKMVADYLAKKAAKPPSPKPPTTSIAVNTPLDKWHAEKINAWYADMDKMAKDRGLDPTKLSQPAREARAKKLGFNTDLTLYHGTGSKNIWRLKWKEGDPEPAVFVADDPKIASAYSGSGHIMELWGKLENPKTIDWGGHHFSSSKMSNDIMQAKAEGHDGLIIKNILDIGSSKPHNQYAFFKPGNLRSKGAAMFDKNVKEPEAHLLSSAATPLHEVLAASKADYEAKLGARPGMAEMAKRGVDMVKGVLAPETLRGPLRGDAAAASIRKNFGRMEQEEARSVKALEAYRDVTRKMPLEQQLDVLEWLQMPEDAAQKHAKTAYTFEPPDELKPLLQGFKDIMLKWRAILESRGKTAAMGFKEDYVPQMWRDPDAARAKLLEGGGATQGSGGFTKKSEMASYREGIKEGLVPETTDPVEIAIRYVENASHYVALNDTLEEGAVNHDIVWRAPNHAPTGWVKLDGRAKTFKGGGMQDAYAPPGFATVYNNFVSHSPNTPMGSVLTAAQRISNMSSMLQLGLSGYHLTNIAGESMISGMANAIDEAAGGDLMTAAVKAISAYGKPITSVRRGMQLRDAYLDNSMGSPMLKEVVRLAADANFRVVGQGRAADEYRFSNVMSLWESWRKGLLAEQGREALKDIKANPVAGTVRQVAGLTARALQSLSDPLFKYYIPLVKNGAYYDMVATWLKHNPGASEAEQVAFARKAADTIDNRFGEMNQDSIFWPRWQKQLAQSALLSYSYTLGTTRMGTAVVHDVAALPGRAIRGEKKWTTDLSYALALPIVIGTVGAVYQIAHTGKLPNSLNDLFHPQTGGTDPSTGKAERGVIPSYMKTVYGFAHDPMGELGNKVNPVWKNIYEAMRNQDWRIDVVGQHSSPLVDQMAQRLEHAASSAVPLVFQQPRKGGSHISYLEQFMGVQGANMEATDPEGFKRMMEGKERRDDAVKALHDLNAKRAAMGMPPLRGRGASEFIRHWRPGYGGTQ